MLKSAVRVPLGDVADRLEADLDLFVNDVVDRVFAGSQAARLRKSATFEGAVRKGVLVGVRDALARLRSDAEPPDELPPELVQLAHLQEVHGPELVELSDVWLEAHDAFWDCFAELTERMLDETELCWEVVKAARARTSGHAARIYELFRLAREDEIPAHTRRGENNLVAAVSRALRGHWVDAGELGYDLGNSHIAVIANASMPLDALADHTGRELLRVQGPGGEAWGWLGGQDRLSDADLEELLAWQRSRDGQVAFGDPGEGIVGFSESHYQALEARGITAATGERVVRFADLRLLIAVLRDRQLAEGFIERELGELDHPGERMSELRATLRVYLEQGQSVSATAALRHRDRKTIQRQLRTAERLLHHYVSDRSDELLIALRASDILRHR